VLAEQTDEWAEQRRYMGLEILANARRSTLLADDPKEVPAAITAGPGLSGWCLSRTETSTLQTLEGAGHRSPPWPGPPQEDT
jgi:hypothetical protein